MGCDSKLPPSSQEVALFGVYSRNPAEAGFLATITPMKLFLTSGDLTDVQGAKFRDLLGTAKARRALFITAAAVPYGLDPKPHWLESSLEDMRPFAEEIDETSLEDSSLIPKDLSTYEFIFISGGNSFYLAYRLAETGIGALIKEYIRQDGIYSGSSAGAIILMSSIDHFAPADDPSLAPKTYAGLGVLDLAVIPHADNAHYKVTMAEIAKAYEDEGLETILLNDDQVLLIDGEVRQVI
jgi:dipeptidase E